MKDRIEEFVNKHRALLDNRQPPKEVWKNISKSLEAGNKASSLRYWQAAAVVFFLVAMGSLLIQFAPTENETALSGITEEFNVTEAYYLEQIQSQQGAMVSYFQRHPDLEKDFKNDFLELNRQYSSLKEEYEATGRGEVLSALIKNLQLQHQLLNEQLSILMKIEKENENIAI